MKSGDAAVIFGGVYNLQRYMDELWVSLIGFCPACSGVACDSSLFTFSKVLHFRQSTFRWECVKKADAAPLEEDKEGEQDGKAIADTTAEKRASVVRVAAGGPQARAWHSATRVHNVSSSCSDLGLISRTYTFFSSRISSCLEGATQANASTTCGSYTLERMSLTPLSGGGHKSLVIVWLAAPPRRGVVTPRRWSIRTS